MPRLRVLSNAVAWMPWSGAAFARARDERKPVLLSISATWCRWCQEMDANSYADPSIATIINERFVAIRVDADERPDISERYNLGGWPTTAFLTPDGEILAGGTYFPAERMPAILVRVADTFESRVGTLRDGHPAPDEPETAASAAAPAMDVVCAHIYSTFDQEHGGFGVEPKFPLTAALHLALDLREAALLGALGIEGPGVSREPRKHVQYEQVVVTTLDAMGWGGLYDEMDGGFFRYAATRDWQQPHSEKMLETNAAMLRLYLDAGARLGLARFTERGADILRYIQNWLADPVDGGWRGSQQADEHYYTSASHDERRARTAPAISRVLYADWNATMVSAAFQAAAVFSDDGLRDFALKSFERVLLACYRPGEGVAHYFDGEPRVRGLFADQLAMASAALDAHDLTGNVVYEMMAEELTHYAVRVMWDEKAGGFFDRAGDEAAWDPAIGLMRRRLKPFTANCDAVRMLRRLAAASGEHDFGAVADRTLAAMAPLALAHGPLAAHYVLALRDGPIR